MGSRHVRVGVLLIIIGILAVAAAGGIWVYNLYRESRAAGASQTAQILIEQILQGQRTQENGVEVDSDMPAVSSETPEDMGDMRYIVIDDAAYVGVLSIPSLSLHLPINSTWSYPDLRNSPCRYSGNIEDNSIVIAAHNYRQHFGNISTLAYGDEVMFTDVDGNVFLYSVREIVTVDPSSTYEVINSEFDLTLFTCNFTGRARVVVRCMRL